MHIGLKRGADRFHDLLASLIIGLLQDQPDRRKPRQVPDQLFLGHGAGHIDRPNLDLAPAALLQDAADPAPVGKGKLPRRIRPPVRAGSAAAVPPRARPSS